MRTASASTSVLLLLIALCACTRTPESTRIPLTLRDNSALANIRIADSDVVVQLDTGDSTTVNLYKTVLDEVGATTSNTVSKRVDARGNTL